MTKIVGFTAALEYVKFIAAIPDSECFVVSAAYTDDQDTSCQMVSDGVAFDFAVLKHTDEPGVYEVEFCGNFGVRATLDGAQEWYKAEPSLATLRNYISVLTEYWEDDMISDDTLRFSLKQVAGKYAWLQTIAKEG